MSHLEGKAAKKKMKFAKKKPQAKPADNAAASLTQYTAILIIIEGRETAFKGF
jgi:hypothetical protein